MSTSAGLALPVKAAEAEAAIDIWTSIDTPSALMERENKSIDGIETDAKAFAADVATLLPQIAPELASQPASEGLRQLKQRLKSAREVATLTIHHQTMTGARHDKLDDLARQLARAQATTADAKATLPGEDDLGLALDRLDTRNALRLEVMEFARQLQEVAADHDEAHLRAQLAEVDLDQINVTVDACMAQIDIGRKEYAEAYAAQHSAKEARDLLALGRNAAGLQQQRIEASAQMLRVGQDWLVRHTAVRLARNAIEQHRAKAQNPVIARASQMFATITCGKFAGLVTDFDVSDSPTLKGQRGDGAKVPVDGMSEGTRDQLFLVLRLALLEQRGAEPLPFIGDDLLASFDEARTGETLDLLAQFGTRQQVILFTHHNHVVEIARARLGEAVDIVEL